MPGSQISDETEIPLGAGVAHGGITAPAGRNLSGARPCLALQDQSPRWRVSYTTCPPALHKAQWGRSPWAGCSALCPSWCLQKLKKKKKVFLLPIKWSLLHFSLSALPLVMALLGRAWPCLLQPPPGAKHVGETCLSLSFPGWVASLHERCSGPFPPSGPFTGLSPVHPSLSCTEGPGTDLHTSEIPCSNLGHSPSVSTLCMF